MEVGLGIYGYLVGHDVKRNSMLSKMCSVQTCEDEVLAIWPWAIRVSRASSQVIGQVGKRMVGVTREAFLSTAKRSTVGIL